MSAPAKFAAGPDPVVAAATGTVAGGVLLTTLPLRSIFTDWSWLMVSVGCVLPYLAVVALLRLRSAPRWWHVLAGLVASVLMVLWVFVPQHLLLGVLPTPSSLTDIGDLISGANKAMQQEHAPLASTGPLRLLVASALVALVALTDVLAVLLRRPLLAAAPLLEVLAIASATSSQAAHPVWFAAAAGGFLLILLSGTRLQDRAWGPSVDGSAGRLGGARRMAVTGVLAALIVPLMLPSVSVNVLARATHHNGNGSGSGNGQIVLSSLASLRGSLQRPTPALLFRVKADNGAPFYVRQEVLDQFSNDGWKPSEQSRLEDSLTPLGQGPFPVGPALDLDNPDHPPTSQFKAEFTILALGGSTMPILSNPKSFQTSGGGVWSSATASVVKTQLRRGMTYSEQVQQPAPSVATLKAAPEYVPAFDGEDRERLLSLPELPGSVSDLTNQLTAGLTRPYDRAKAISDYFTNGKNNFVYSLTAPPDDGRNALVTFLEKKQGFCQQYAAAAAVLMRQAGLPSRVVLGYTHRQPDSNGVFTVTTSDAHAWVEVYFQSIGWIPFDPTPLTGADAGRAVDLPWASHPGADAAQTAEPTANRGLSSAGPSVSAEASQAVQAGQHGVSTVLVEIVLLVLLGAGAVVAVIFGPQWLRQRQRRRRLERARTTGNPEPLWLELAATATDRDALWPSTITVGQVAGWLSRHGVDERGRAAVTAVADRVERDRFSAQLVDEMPADSIAALDQALTRWARRTDRRLSLMHRWIPRSLISKQPRWRR
ncbi:transglutaminaseTgpA domain-containing protein [Jatrophihabitans sp.]|jgi:transglutaminase-like putative cysteine protease|uniref:transglutaminase family protein n=1 Tax=Jatrophihabitans sp. TaxID=1932789 RepID=UPI002F0C628F